MILTLVCLSFTIFDELHLCMLINIYLRISSVPLKMNELKSTPVRNREDGDAVPAGC